MPLSKPKKAVRTLTRSSLAGLVFPVDRIHNMLRKGMFAPRIGGDAPVFLAAVLEYVAGEILELSADSATLDDRSKILPQDVLRAIDFDTELNKTFATAVSQGDILRPIAALP